MKTSRIGAYICHCGTNIAGVIDVEEVTKYVSTLPNVIIARHYMYMCSQLGQGLIKEDIKKLKLNRVLVASCSPRMHEPTYRRALEESGVNPFFFEMANIREQVAWAHMNEPKKATEKAKDLIRMAIARANLLEPISKMEVKVTKRALVVGAGVAGITAASDLANMGFQVYLLEKQPYVGGHLVLLNQLSDGRQATQLLKLLEKQLSNPQIKLFVNSQVLELNGYIGNFQAKIVVNPPFVDDRCDLCGKCVEVCPITIPDQFNLGLTQRKPISLIPNSYPSRYYIDEKSCTRCGACSEACAIKAINFKEKPLNLVIDVGVVIVTTGFEVYEPKEEFGYRKHKDIITQLFLERILSKNGPTKGKLTRPSDAKVPKKVAFIMCVGSRQENSVSSETPVNSYCSRFCCSSALKNALLLKSDSPEMEVYILYRDIRTFERGNEELYRKCRANGIIFIRFKQDEPPDVLKTRDDELVIKVKDYLFGAILEISVDLVVLVEGMVPRADAGEVRAQFSITRSADGFFQEMHAKMNPLNTFAEGIFIAGSCQAPKNVEDTISQASGAAAKAAILLNKGRVVIDLVTATVDETLCIGCAKCVRVCPFKAIELDEIKQRVKVTDVKCKGCGSCSATCPVGAIQLRHFQDKQILVMVENLLPAS